MNICEHLMNKRLFVSGILLLTTIIGATTTPMNVHAASEMNSSGTVTLMAVSAGRVSSGTVTLMGVSAGRVSSGTASSEIVTSVFNESAALQALKAKFASNVVFRAEMSHHFTDAYTSETTDTYGTIWFGINAYRIETPDQIIVVQGDVSRVFNKRQNRLIISHYNAEEDEFAPSRFFAGTQASYRSQDIAGSDGSVTILITSDDPFELFSEVRIRVGRDGNPIQIQAIDQMDNTVRTIFSFGRFERAQDNLFHISYTSGTDVVDLRQ